ncbi:MAG: hypothetical protein Q9188_003164 [Gyalolechia gomerana]
MVLQHGGRRTHALDHYCDPTMHVDNDNVQPALDPETPAAMHKKGIKEPGWIRRRTFAQLRQIGYGSQALSTNNEGVTDYATLLSAAVTIDEAAKIITEGLTTNLSRAIKVTPESVGTKKPLHQYRVDSLLGVELRNWFTKKYAA